MEHEDDTPGRRSGTHRVSAAERLLRVVSRPVRRSRGRIVIHAYRGYGTPDHAHVVGRVFRQPGAKTVAPSGRLGSDLLALLRRFLRWGRSGCEVEGEFSGGRERVRTDRSGWFQLRVRPRERPAPRVLWHSMQLRLVERPSVETRVPVLVPPTSASHVVISDIDDTVVHTGVASFLQMLRSLFLSGAESRTAFPGVGAFYRALHAGSGSGHACNPMLYVSRGPWSSYEVLERFYALHDIPVGPVLFLRDWGVTLQHPLPRRAVRHKEALIEEMLSIYTDRPFVLIGDSGQRDPEIYAQVVQRHCDRIAAVYIRNVDANDASRQEAIDELARQVETAGSSLLLAADSLAMAEHAAARGLIRPTAVREVEEAMRAQDERPHPVEHECEPRGAAEAAERGEVSVAVEGDGAGIEHQDRSPGRPRRGAGRRS